MLSLFCSDTPFLTQLNKQHYIIYEGIGMIKFFNQYLFKHVQEFYSNILQLMINLTFLESKCNISFPPLKTQTF